MCAKVECSFCLRVFNILSLTHVLHHPLDIHISRDDIFYNELQLIHYEIEYKTIFSSPTLSIFDYFPTHFILLHWPMADTAQLLNRQFGHWRQAKVWLY